MTRINQICPACRQPKSACRAIKACYKVAIASRRGQVANEYSKLSDIAQELFILSDDVEEIPTAIPLDDFNRGTMRGIAEDIHRVINDLQQYDSSYVPDLVHELQQDATILTEAAASSDEYFGEATRNTVVMGLYQVAGQVRQMAIEKMGRKARSGCPVCGGERVQGCRCASRIHGTLSTEPKRIDAMHKGHGSQCVNGHRWIGSTVITVKQAQATEDEEQFATEIAKQVTDFAGDEKDVAQLMELIKGKSFAKESNSAKLTQRAHI